MKRDCLVVLFLILSVSVPSQAGWWDAWFSEAVSATGTALAPDAPVLLSPQDGTIFQLGDPIVLSWESVNDATGYYYELNGVRSPAPVTETQINLPLNPYALGNFDWRVQALGNHEVGPWSPMWSFYREDDITPTPTPFGTPLPNLDVDANGRVDYRDTFIFLAEWQQEDAPHDFTGEGRLEHGDVLLYLRGWKSPGRLFPSPTPSLPAPQLSEPTDGQVIDFWDIHYFDPLQGKNNGVWFRWSAVEGAERYDLRIQGPEGWSNLEDYIESGIGSTEFKVTLPVRPDNSHDLGLYRWQVRGFSAAQGGAGAYSDPFTFTIAKPTPTVTPTPIAIPRSADLDENGRATIEDIFTFASAWGISEASQPQQYGVLENADLDRSGRIGAEDLHLFLASYHRRVAETLSAPVLLSPTDGLDVPLLQAVLPDFQWTFQASAGAAFYEYEILQPPPLDQDPVRDFINDTGKVEYNLRSVITPGIRGRWQWRVRAYGPAGRMSLWSPQWSFVVY